MNNFYTNLFFLLLNNGLYLAIAAWLIKYHLLPAIRASKTRENETHTQLSTEVLQQRTALQATQDHYHIQTREIARLTTALEKWTGILSQRAATTEQELRELSFRYKNRCEENARARALKQAHKIVTTQVLKNVRALLIQEYKSQAKQDACLDAVFRRMRSGDLS